MNELRHLFWEFVVAFVCCFNYMSCQINLGFITGLLNTVKTKGVFTPFIYKSQLITVLSSG